ncbi:Predicted Fe2+/Mn2+ transporter, VIT1/CCC1 family [Microlunatus sagamiharensis]|uniref:Predicted Fe2+/Mn2+ transporter, VIT1/CCC1 family n=1 Tax=Microlunatus sagamiharensis TaxID=546874 RepID=A0A1H2MV28_9ACTN|nr:Predicted Fe2+/Mn2+ transporter, VIT1/CCC1 family [Microlunatus sagamiharensis]
MVIGVAGAGASTHTLVASGTAALVGGALSMALGEYVSVSSQRDAQTTLIAKERAELAAEPEAELDELTGLYQERGLSYETARQVAVELTAHDALGAHLSAELNLSEDDVVSAGQAAAASAAAFLTGGLLPFLAIVLLPDAVAVPLTFVAVLLALGVTGFASARFNETPTLRPTLRLVVGGAVALAATFAIGSLLGTTVGG